MARCYWQPDRSGRPHARGPARPRRLERGALHARPRRQGLARGWNAVLLNQRNCGGTEHLTPGLYHSGLTADPARGHRDARRDRRPARLRRRRLLARRQSGDEAGRRARRRPDAASACRRGRLPDDRSRAVRPRDRAARQHSLSVELRAQPEARMRRKAAAWPGAFDLSPLDRIWTIRAVRRRLHGAASRLRRRRELLPAASALRVVDRIRIPALILAAEDDPFVPGDQFRDAGDSRQSARARARRARTADTAGSSASRRRRRLLGGARRRCDFLDRRSCQR